MTLKTYTKLEKAKKNFEEYETWTESIIKHTQKAQKNHQIQTTTMRKKISTKGKETVIKKLKRNKSLGPDKIPKETFIEANKETKQLLKTMIENIHAAEDMPKAGMKGK